MGLNALTDSTAKKLRTLLGEGEGDDGKPSRRSVGRQATLVKCTSAEAVGGGDDDEGDICYPAVIVNDHAYATEPGEFADCWLTLWDVDGAPAVPVEGQVYVAILSGLLELDGDTRQRAFGVPGGSGGGAAVPWRVKAASTKPGTLSTDFADGSIVDYIAVEEGQVIGIFAQADPRENGLYVVGSSGTPTRWAGATNALMSGALIYVEGGTSNAGTLWKCVNPSDPPIVFGADDLQFELVDPECVLELTDVYDGTYGTYPWKLKVSNGNSGWVDADPAVSGTNAFSLYDQRELVAGTLVTAYRLAGHTDGWPGFWFGWVSPTKEKGDLIAHNGQEDIRVPVSTNGRVLVCDSGAAAGVSWQSSTDVVVAGGGLTWVKFHLTYTDIQAAATYDSTLGAWVVSLMTLSAGSIIHACVAKTSTAFVDPFALSYSASVGFGSGSNYNRYLNSYSLTAAVSGTNFGNGPGNTFDNRPIDFGGGTFIRLAIFTGAANLTFLTAGAVDIWLLTSTLP